jgi:general secretion pathway protein K
MKARNRGAALLAAMLTVVLVATFASAALWQQWRSIEVETAERARVQSEWILTGALDWARLILREDRNGVDHLGEPWAVPLEEARLSSFLAADRNNSGDSGAEVLDAFLSGQIVDLQSLLNVNTLVDVNGGTASDSAKAAFGHFARLFELLGLPPTELARLVQNLSFATASSGSAPNPAAPLVPQEVEQLVWLGVAPETVAALQPYVTLLPSHNTIVNLNTARAEVIYASLDQVSMADAQRLVSARERAYFRNTDDAKRAIGASDAAFAQASAAIGVATQFFEITSRLRLDQLVVEERSMVQRDGNDVRILRRRRGAAQAPAAQAPSAGR